MSQTILYVKKTHISRFYLTPNHLGSLMCKTLFKRFYIENSLRSEGKNDCMLI